MENTPWIINKYREQALAQGYTGDSIINSVMDSAAMIAGFVLARRWPLWIVVVLGIGMELYVGWMIRDNLTFNVLGFVHQFDFIREWQSAP